MQHDTVIFRNLVREETRAERCIVGRRETKTMEWHSALRSARNRKILSRKGEAHLRKEAAALCRSFGVVLPNLCPLSHSRFCGRLH